MRPLFLALHTEGETDDRFLPAVIERTVSQLVNNDEGEWIEVMPISLVNPAKPTFSGGADRIVEAARLAWNCHVLIVHKDADAPTPDDALLHRFHPGEQLVRQVPTTEMICRTLVPIVPARMTEAWLLADLPTILREIGTDITEKELRIQLKKRSIILPSREQQVSSILHPKNVLDQIVNILRGRRDLTRQELYEPVGQTIALERLRKVHAYHQFVQDITDALKALHIIVPPTG